MTLIYDVGSALKLDCSTGINNSSSLVELAEEFDEYVEQITLPWGLG